MKNTKKWISVLLVAMLLISTVVATGVSVSAASGTLTHYYSTNGSGYGKEKTITVDGDISDWDSSMLIAQGTANDDPRVYRPNSMYELAEDLYALYAAYDSSNLYLMWEMTNVQDVVSPLDNYPLTQGILYETSEFPLFIFIDTGKSADAIGNQGKTNTGGTLWDKHITTDNSFNRVIATDVKGNNGPWVYGGDASGVNPVEMYNRTTSGITVKYGKGILSQQVNGINKGHGTNNNRVPGDVCNESAEWVDFNTLGHTSSTLDFHYEVSIPLEKLGITKSDITSNGIGAMLVITSGMSGMDSLPYDLSMSDQADLDDGEHSHENNSFEKSDDDHITAPFARIGAQGNAPTAPTQPPTQPTQPTDPTTPSTELTVNAKSNLFPTSTQAGLEVGDTVTVKYNLTASKKITSADWTLSYDSSKLRLKTSGEDLCPVGGGTVNSTGNPVYGNFTDINSQFDFTGGGVFVQAEFEVLATGSTDVNLTVNEMNVMNGTTIDSVVENGVEKTVSGVTVTPTSEAVTGGSTNQSLTVKGVSNFFEGATKTFETAPSKVTVTYQLQSSLKLIDSQWELTYDSSKLSLDSISMPKVTAPYLKSDTAGIAAGNFAGTEGVAFGTMGDFVSATFTVKGKGTATVNLNVLNLGVSKNNVTYLVNNGSVQTVSGLTYSTKTLINEVANFKRGDVDLNGTVEIADATKLQRYLAEYETLTAQQLLAADANKDGRVDVRDVTAIQRALAKIESIPA